MESIRDGGQTWPKLSDDPHQEGEERKKDDDDATRASCQFPLANPALST